MSNCFNLFTEIYYTGQNHYPRIYCYISLMSELIQQVTGQPCGPLDAAAFPSATVCPSKPAQPHSTLAIKSGYMMCKKYLGEEPGITMSHLCEEGTTRTKWILISGGSNPLLEPHNPTTNSTEHSSALLPYAIVNHVGKANSE